MKKAFTLIELLAVIIILAIVALIATPIILDVVDDAKNSAAKSEAAMIVSGVNNYCAAAEMREQLNGTLNICKDGVTPEEVASMVDLGNAKVKTITYGTEENNVALAMALVNARVASNTSKKVTYLEIESNGRTVIYDGSTYTIDGKVVETPEEPITPPAPTYAAYSVGDDVTLTDGTTWVVVKDSTVSESEIKLMSTSNVRNNLTTETGTAMFNGTTLGYDDNLNIWEDSMLKSYLDTTVKTSLETSLNTIISDITIWGAEELTTLGCTVTGNDTEGYYGVSCDNTKPWYSRVFQNTYSWTKLPHAGRNYYAWYVRNDGIITADSVAIANYSGARPIITVSKSVIAQ